jgi:hypothetical protein
LVSFVMSYKGKCKWLIKLVLGIINFCIFWVFWNRENSKIFCFTAIYYMWIIIYIRKYKK